MTKNAQSSVGTESTGFCVWLTGLSGSGKTTIAEYLQEPLSATGAEAVVLDGDILRKTQNKDLGFSRQDRMQNVLRIGRMAVEVVQTGGIAIAALISPYEETRNKVRSWFDKDQFILVYLSTPLAICERRDPKGLYKRARLGEINNFTGVSDPYEPPVDPDLNIDTSITSVEDTGLLILHKASLLNNLDKL